MPPDASIIIRTLNEAKYLENLLKGIHSQNHRDWEIVLVDSGSSDGTVEIARQYGARVFHIPKEEFTYGRSLNLGCQEALGRYLVFVSGHVWPITNTWLSSLLKPFAEAEVAMVYGRQRGTAASNLCEVRDFLMQFGVTSQILVDEPKGHNGNSAVRRDLWVDQPFDESLPAQEDVDWARKIQKKRYRVYYAADAAVYHVHEESLKQVYRRNLNETVATKRMFPHNQPTWTDMVRRLPYFIALDFLFALRTRQFHKLFRVPMLRAAQFMGLYRGLRHQKRLATDTLRHQAIPDTYRSVVVDKDGNHGLHEAQVPQVKPWDVLVKIAFARVDSDDREGTNNSCETHRSNARPMSFIPGQDFSGVVVKSGSAAKGWSKGDKVAGVCAIGDRCSGQNGREPENAGSQDAELEVTGGIGAYSEYIVARPEQIWKIPTDMPLKDGALVRSVALCVGNLRHLQVEPGLSVCVVGASLMGNLCVQVLRSRGIHVTVVDRNTGWLSLLSKLDVDILDEPGLVSGYDCLIETSGEDRIVSNLISNLTPAAKLMLMGPQRVRGNHESLGLERSSNLTILCPGEQSQEDWKEAVRLVRLGAVGLDDRAESVEALENYESAWNSAESGEHLRVLLRTGKDLEDL